MFITYNYQIIIYTWLVWIHICRIKLYSKVNNLSCNKILSSFLSFHTVFLRRAINTVNHHGLVEILRSMVRIMTIGVVNGTDTYYRNIFCYIITYTVLIRNFLLYFNLPVFTLLLVILRNNIMKTKYVQISTSHPHKVNFD